ncbi:hypothetical protein [Streptomonospora wellingtoniae]|uniref:SPOR domain-containing protein n=1 Tax=Streptomonospora wellingtoniae TaxID=3075544 RepID=A0ABU2KUE5_9ACTN|nr:hypothetical protein [Streptomonospora sp. DSM 45055]MDT0302693.1 hypothetical protein [Streptomonospora sp. DSM 45055]
MIPAVGTGGRGGPPALYELRVGVFATPEGVRDFVHRARALPAGPEGAAARRWTVSIA